MRDGYFVLKNSTELSLKAGLIRFEEGCWCERAEWSSNSIGLDLALRRRKIPFDDGGDYSKQQWKKNHVMSSHVVEAYLIVQTPRNTADTEKAVHSCLPLAQTP